MRRGALCATVLLAGCGGEMSEAEYRDSASTAVRDIPAIVDRVSNEASAADAAQTAAAAREEVEALDPPSSALRQHAMTVAALRELEVAMHDVAAGDDSAESLGRAAGALMVLARTAP